MELSRSFLKALLFISLSLANPVTLLCILFYNLDSYDESLIHYLYFSWVEPSTQKTISDPEGAI